MERAGYGGYGGYGASKNSHTTHCSQNESQSALPDIIEQKNKFIRSMKYPENLRVQHDSRKQLYFPGGNYHFPEKGSPKSKAGARDGSFKESERHGSIVADANEGPPAPKYSRERTEVVSSSPGKRALDSRVRMQQHPPHPPESQSAEKQRRLELYDSYSSVVASGPPANSR